MTKEPATHSVSVAGVVIDEDGRVLVIERRDNGHWESPGGILELGETFEEGVRREVLEETGVQVSVGALTGVYKKHEPRNRGSRVPLLDRGGASPALQRSDFGSMGRQRSDR